MEQLFEDFLKQLHALNRDFVDTFADLPAEALDWVPGADMNSLCVLVVHTTSSARYWIGDVALSEPSNRDRDAEFKAQGLTHEQLEAHFANLEAYVSTALAQVSLDTLATIHELPTRQVSGMWALLHALAHTALHLGHAQITRQLWQQR